MSSESGSDIEMQSALPKKAKKKMPESPSEGILKKEQGLKKMTTKDMIHDALAVLNTRKGVSLYAVKKFVTEKYDVNVEKINYLLKKSIKSEVEKGSIIQTKGIGASGSFKLAPKKKPDKPIKKKTEKKPKKEKTDKTKESKKVSEISKSKKEKVESEITKPKKEKLSKTTKKKVETKSSKTVNKKEKSAKAPKAIKEKEKVEKNMAKEKQTPAKKRAAMMKRKSIGSIIKPPKMKPKAR